MKKMELYFNEEELLNIDLQDTNESKIKTMFEFFSKKIIKLNNQIKHQDDEISALHKILSKKEKEKEKEIKLYKKAMIKLKDKENNKIKLLKKVLKKKETVINIKDKEIESLNIKIKELSNFVEKKENDLKFPRINLEEKILNINSNGIIMVKPSYGFDGIKSIEINTNIQPNFQSQCLTVNRNSKKRIKPDDFDDIYHVASKNTLYDSKEVPISTVVDFHRTNYGLAIVTLPSGSGLYGFKSPIFLNIIGNNFPINNVLTTIEITSPNGLTIDEYNQSQSPKTNYTGFINAIPKIYNLYTSSNPYNLLNGNVLKVPTGYSGFGDIYISRDIYNINKFYYISSDNNSYIYDFSLYNRVPIATDSNVNKINWTYNQVTKNVNFSENSNIIWIKGLDGIIGFAGMSCPNSYTRSVEGD
eukprot:jgi/Orpsp1_1/1177861/evm.model.c7180000063143.1